MNCQAERRNSLAVHIFLFYIALPAKEPYSDIYGSFINAFINASADLEVSWKMPERR